MIDDFFELFRDYRQDSQIGALRRRLDSLSDDRRRTTPERNMAAALVRLLLKKGLITADELADEMEAVNEEQFGKVRDGFRLPGDPLDVDRIARLDGAGVESPPKTRLDPQ